VDDVEKRYISCIQWESNHVSSDIQVVALLLVIFNWYNYLLTSWSRDLLEKLTGSQLVKKFLAFYGTQRFITAFACACHLSLS
jgi:hypothetical protein